MPKAAPLHLLTAIEIHRALQSLSRVLFMTTEALARSILGVLNEAQITYRIITLRGRTIADPPPFSPVPGVLHLHPHLRLCTVWQFRPIARHGSA
jgi:hypothetical protein